MSAKRDGLLKNIQKKIQKGQYFVTDHAIQESFSDNIDFQEVLNVIQTGECIETYSDRQRLLMAGKTKLGKMLHIVIDYSVFNPEIITVYKPDLREWKRGKVRK